MSYLGGAIELLISKGKTMEVQTQAQADRKFRKDMKTKVEDMFKILVQARADAAGHYGKAQAKIYEDAMEKVGKELSIIYRSC